MLLKQFWIDAGIRAIRTMAQTAVGVLGTASVMSDVDWRMTLSSVLLAGITSLLMSLDRLQAAPNGKEALTHDSA